MDAKIAYLISLYPRLTRREAEIIALKVFTSLGNKQIGAMLGITERTVKNTFYQCTDETLENRKCDKVDIIREIVINILWDKLNPPL